MEPQRFANDFAMDDVRDGRLWVNAGAVCI